MNEFMRGLDATMIGEFYQTPFVWDSWIFKLIINIFNTIALYINQNMYNVMNYKKWCSKII
jgi:hypothetical protein